MSLSARQLQFDAERDAVRAATERLLSGNPIRSNGKLTVAALAIEAEVSRQRLYEHHDSILAEFKTASGGGPVAPDVSALQRQLATAHDRIRELESREKRLNTRISALSAVIAELTHEAEADNVIALPRGHRQKQHPAGP
jgi:uncharacterized protein involved in exopolysaccharide biosynthesis